jgi:hypothetical protein
VAERMGIRLIFAVPLVFSMLVDKKLWETLQRAEVLKLTVVSLQNLCFLTYSVL